LLPNSAKYFTPRLTFRGGMMGDKVEITYTQALMMSVK
jgi:hypothetical protein